MTLCECSEPTETIVQGTICCSVCYCLLDELVFEETLFKNDFKNKARLNKFTILVQSHTTLPWFVRETLIDFFPKIERHFYASSRVNFINMNQLVRIMCTYAGFPEYAVEFKQLKTKERIKQVEKFVQDALKSSGLGPREPLPSMRELKYLEPRACTSTASWMTKVRHNDHIYTDNSIYGKSSIDKGDKVKQSNEGDETQRKMLSGMRERF